MTDKQTSPGTTDPAQKAKALRRARLRQLQRRLGIVVVIPTLLVAAYYGLVASDRFESHSVITLQSAEIHAVGGFASLLGSISGGGGTQKAKQVEHYILSRDMLNILDRKTGFSKHCQSENADWWSRLATAATNEEKYKYYKKLVSIEYDAHSGVLTLRVRAFTPQKAQEFAATILKSSETFVNQLSERSRLDRMKFAQKEVAKAEAQLAKKRQAILKLQAERDEFNPVQSAGALVTVGGELEGELAQARAELQQARAFMRPDAPKVVLLRQKVQSILSQIQLSKKRLISPGKKGLSSAIARFEEAMLQKEFAEKKLVSALSAMEIAGLEAVRQHSYLATIAGPSLPEEATYPKRVMSSVKAFFLFLSLFVIGSLLIAAVREHARL